MKEDIYVNDSEYIVPEDHVLISRTDLVGDITYANDCFVQASGYSYDELHGAHHNLVRHPDMPAVAFQNLWDTIKQGMTWNGIVKNRRKDGGFYWVKANVTPYYANGVLTGYTSVRVRPSQQEIDLAQKAYPLINAGKGGQFTLDRGTLGVKGLRARLKSFNARSIKTQLSIVFLAGLCGQVANLYTLHSTVGFDSVAPSLLWSQLSVGAISVLIMGGLALQMKKTILRPIDDASDFAASISAGNINVDSPAFPKNELNKLFFFLDTTKRSIATIANDVRKNVHDVSSSSGEIMSGNRDLENRTEVQASSVQQSAASMEEINTTVKQNAANALQAKTLADKSSQFVHESGKAMTKVVETMKNIADTSGKMTEIVNVIESIAFQTNLLALNASVEAARAGEHGRGFAVVASEVRNLASRSSESAKQVRLLISQSSDVIKDGYDLVSDAEDQVGKLVDSVEHLSAIMSEITNASQEQSIGISQINEGINQIDVVTNENANLVKEAARSVTRLENSIIQTLRSVEVFDVKT